MKTYLKKRIITGMLTIVFAFILTFFLARSVPGNPISILGGTDTRNPKQIKQMNKIYGLDKSPIVQFGNYVKEVMKGNFGYSFRNNKPVTDIILEKIIPTLILSLTASILSVIIGTTIGLYAGRNNGSALDKIFTIFSYITDALPVFWLALMLIVLFATKLGWLPTSGMYSIREDYKGIHKFLDLLRHMVLPIMTIVIVRVPYFFRIAKTSVISIMNDQFIKTLRATGMNEDLIFGKYVLRNAIIPIITAFSMSLATVIAGVAMVEIVFAWPGMGRVLMDSIAGRDYAVISGLYLMISISVSVFMLITDIIYVLIDPRMKLE